MRYGGGEAPITLPQLAPATPPHPRSPPSAAGVARRLVPALQLITFTEPLLQSIRAAAPQHASALILQEAQLHYRRAACLLQMASPRAAVTLRAGQGQGGGAGEERGAEQRWGFAGYMVVRLQQEAAS